MYRTIGKGPLWSVQSDVGAYSRINSGYFEPKKNPLD